MATRLFSPAAASRGSSPAVVPRLFIAVASLVVERGLRHLGFRSCGSWSLEHRLSIVVGKLRCSRARGIFQDWGSNTCLMHWQVDSL